MAYYFAGTIEFFFKEKAISIKLVLSNRYKISEKESPIDFAEFSESSKFKEGFDPKVLIRAQEQITTLLN